MNFFLTLFVLGVITFLVVGIASNKTVISIKDSIEQAGGELLIKCMIVGFGFGIPAGAAFGSFDLGITAIQKGDLFSVLAAPFLMVAGLVIGLITFVAFWMFVDFKIYDWRDRFR